MTEGQIDPMSPIRLESEALSVLCDPDTRFPLEMDSEHLRNTATGRVFPLRNGIPLFVSTLTGSNLRNLMLYERLAASYDLAEGLRRWVTFSPDHRPELLSALEIKSGDRVLEVGAGTGASLPFLPADISFFGVDLSWNMLRKCQRKARRLRRKAHLFQGEAEHLPFQGEVFDSVFHVGGILGFTDPARAIKEMIWVAKPGAKIVIVDELDKRHRMGKTPGSGNHDAGGLLQSVPEEMREVHAAELVGGRYFCLSFRKP